MSAFKGKNCFMIVFLSLTLVGCGGAQTFLQQSGAAYKRGEKIEWTGEPSTKASDWSTYMDMEGG